MPHTMTFEGADDAAFSSGVVSLTIQITGADPSWDFEGEEQTSWSHRKGKATTKRRSIRVYWHPEMTVADTGDTGALMDHGYYEAFVELCSKPHRRITATTLVRVSRTFAAGVLAAAFNLWSDETSGILPFEFEHASTSLPRAETGTLQQMSITTELFAPEVG